MTDYITDEAHGANWTLLGWAYVVVTTPERGPDGKFVKRGRR